MKKIFNSFIILLLFSQLLNAQEWTNSTGIISSGSVTAKELLYQDGNIYSCGIFTGSLGDTLASYGSNDWFLAKYGSDFVIDWVKQIGGTGQERDVSMAFDSNKDIIIGGSFLSTCNLSATESLISDGLYDIMLAKYNGTDGSLMWYKTAAWGKSGQLMASLSVDKNDDILITGFYKDSLVTNVDTLRGTGFQNFILKLDATGNYLWSKNILSSNTITRISAISTFSDAYYVSGTYQDSIFFDNDTLIADVESKSKAFIYKLGYDGTSQWSRSSYGDNSDATGTIAQDLEGSIYFSGYYNSSDFRMDSDDNNISESLTNNGSSDAFIVKYNSIGDMLWLKGYGKAGSEYAIDIKEKEGILYFTGRYSDSLIINLDTLFNSDPTNNDIFLATADYNGNMLKGESLNGTGVFEDFGVEIEITDLTHAILFGNFDSPSLTIGTNTLTNTVSPNSQSFIAEYTPPFSSQFTSISEVSCNAGTNGELIVTPYFGVSPYTYEWSHDAGLNDSTATGLGAGLYTVTVTDNIANTAIAQYTLVEPDDFIFDPVITPVTTCSYSLEGEINLNVTGGNGDNTYLWAGSGTIVAAEDQTGLAIGQYSVTVTDNKSCYKDTIILINGPEEMHYGNSDTTSYYGVGFEGAIDLEITGGTGTPSLYAASWTGPSGYTNTVQDINTLQPGTYNVTVTDGNGCIGDTSFVIVNKFEFSSYIESKKDACNGVSDGRAKVNFYSPVGHTAITYLWDSNAGNQDTQEATGLAGSVGGIKYYVTVTDTEEEPDVSILDSVIIYELTYAFDGSLSGPTSVDCYGDSDGYIDLSITSPGILPYVFNWSNGETTEDIYDLVADFYSVTVTDNNECTFSKTNREITEPEFPLSASASVSQNILCNGNYNGSVTVSPGGGNGSYSYKWSDGGSQSTQTATNLSAGYYTVTVSDFKGCKTTASVNLTEPDVLTIEGSVGNLTCNNNSSGTIVLTVGGGTPIYSYVWTSSDGDGFVVTNPNQSGLSAGQYEVTVKDANLCEIADTFDVTEPTQIIIDLESKVDVTGCNGDNTGEINVSASGGTGQLNYVLNPGSVQTNNTGSFTGLEDGTYSINITDDNGCGPITSSSFVLTEPTAISIDSENSTDASSQSATDGTITIGASGGTGNLLYTISPGGTENPTGEFTGLATGEYTVSVSDDNNCGPVVSNSITIGYPDGIDDLVMKDKISIYPNPTSSNIIINVNLDYLTNVKIEILNTSGQVLQNRFIVKNKVINEEIDLSALNKGIYLIRISADQFNYIEKIVLQ